MTIKQLKFVDLNIKDNGTQRFKCVTMLGVFYVENPSKDTWTCKLVHGAGCVSAVTGFLTAGDAMAAANNHAERIVNSMLEVT